MLFIKKRKLMAEIHVQRKPNNLWWLWLLIILIIAAVIYYLYTHHYFNTGEVKAFNYFQHALLSGNRNHLS